MDEDLAAMTRDQLIGEARRMRAGIRAHRDSTGHALCWHHPALWALLPEPFPIGREIKMLELVCSPRQRQETSTSTYSDTGALAHRARFAFAREAMTQRANRH